MIMFTHVSDKGVHMVDISDKSISKRTAVAKGSIILKRDTIDLIANDKIKKGNVFSTAQVAGTLAVKKTSDLIPMCHQVSLDKVIIDFETYDDHIDVICIVKTTNKTGVEMEALVGVSQALLTIWDMVKANEKDEDGQYPGTRIENIHVIKKEK